jgi:hypothetical protein
MQQRYACTASRTCKSYNGAGLASPGMRHSRTGDCSGKLEHLAAVHVLLAHCVSHLASVHRKHQLNPAGS